VGLYARARRELVASLRERAARLEADQQHSAEQAREAERRRIAREMHDVLAHRLSLLSVRLARCVGELVHADVKKLGNVPDGGGHRIAGCAQGQRNLAATPAATSTATPGSVTPTFQLRGIRAQRTIPYVTRILWTAT
jgi:hypothetical protein